VKTILNLWQDFGLSKINRAQLLDGIHNIRRLTEVSLDINFQCNFSCAYCSYGFKQLHRRELTLQEWRAVIDDCVDNGAKLFALAGKEPLINDRFREILLYLKTIRQNLGRELIFGLVTNGWYLEENTDNLLDMELNYIDVSLDGHKEIHDKNRKKGSFDRALSGLLLACEKKVAKKVFISSVLHAGNYKDIPFFVRDMYSKGIKHFNISLLYPTANTPEHLLIRKNEYRDFFTTLLPSIMGSLPTPCDLEIIIDVFTFALPFLRDLVQEQVIDINEIYVDDIDSLFSFRELANGCTIYTRFALDHLAYGKAIKITADGYCMVDYEALTMADYWRHSVGNVLDRPISVLYERLFDDRSYLARLANQVSKEVCPKEPCYPLCLGKNDGCMFLKASTKV